MTTTIIRAEVVQLQNETYQVRFIYPGKQKDSDNPFKPFLSQADIERALAFNQRNFVRDKLKAWLHQRLRARPDQHQLIANLEFALSNLERAPIGAIARYVNEKRECFETIAPGSEKSRCFNYYNTVIITILDFCRDLQTQTNN